MQPVSQYQVTKARKELRHMLTAKAEMRTKSLDYIRRGRLYGWEQAMWRYIDLRNAIAAERKWLAGVRIEKAIGWSPARRARHGFAPV